MPEQSQRRWQMFMVRPEDLLTLLRVMETDDAKIYAAHFPPDVRVHGAYYLEERDCFVMVLESQFFDPVEVIWDAGQWSGEWNELLFTLDQTDSEAEVGEQELWVETLHAESAADREFSPRTLPQLAEADLPYTRWKMFWIRPDQLLLLFRMVADRRKIVAAPFPPDARLIYASYDADRNAFGLLMVSEDFDAIGMEVAGEVFRLIIPEGYLTPTPFL